MHPRKRMISVAPINTSIIHMSNVLKFRGKDPAVTVEEALDIASKAGYKEILILGYDEEDYLRVVCTEMNSKDALWILRNAEMEIL